MVETMVAVERGDELGEGYRRRITEVYVRSFAEDFVAFSRDTGKLADAFEHMLLLERFYIALVDGEPAGLASLTEGDQTLFAPRWREIRRHLGLARGLLGYVVIRSWFMRALRRRPTRARRDRVRRHRARLSGSRRRDRAAASPARAARVSRVRARGHQGHQRTRPRPLRQARLHGVQASEGAIRPTRRIHRARVDEARAGPRAATLRRAITRSRLTGFSR